MLINFSPKQYSMWVCMPIKSRAIREFAIWQNAEKHEEVKVLQITYFQSHKLDFFM
jgi:hypothetical protein